jgi:hypothetical protein
MRGAEIDMRRHQSRNFIELLKAFELDMMFFNNLPDNRNVHQSAEIIKTISQFEMKSLLTG